jgi:tight adherence protein B
VIARLLVTGAAAEGTFLLYTRAAFGWRRLRVPWLERGIGHRAVRRWVTDWLAQAGLADVAPRDIALTSGVLFVATASLALLVFGGIVPSLLVGLLGASLPMGSFRQRRQNRRRSAQEAWPRLIEEIRILTGSGGRSIPQALFEAGARGPEELVGAFDAARREWLISTDLERALRVLKAQLADAAADAACETLLIAHELGGTDVDRRLEDLADDRRADVHYRKDVRARQSGVRFARRFVLLVPLGMAFAGLSVGNGRAAYETPLGQAAVATALVMVGLCWWWAGHLLRLPDGQRVFRS